MQGKQKAETQQRSNVAGCMLRRRRLRLFAFKFFTLNSFEACQQKSKQSYKRREAPQGRGKGKRRRYLWLGLNAAQNEANTYVATVGCATPCACRPTATKMTGGLDSFELQKLPLLCLPCLHYYMMWAWQAPELHMCTMVCVCVCVCSHFSHLTRLPLFHPRRLPLSSLFRCS